MTSDEVLISLGFTVVDNIGEGSFGTVKLATSTKYPNQVAIKVIDPRDKSPEFASKFLSRELRILRTVKHPHIVQVHEIVKRAGRVFIMMEPAATTLLKKTQELRRIPVDQAKVWFSQLLSAMVYLHKRNFVHRDLKCENVLLTADNQVKLTDFGFGRYSRGLPDLSSTFCYSPHYAAPEVLMHEIYNPKKSDVWSLGVILYIMVTGTMPFDDSDERNLIQLQRKPLGYPKGITVEEPCRAFISHLLQYNPFSRPSVAEVAKHPWLQPRQEHEMSEAAQSSAAEAVSSPQENVFGNMKKLCEESCKEIRQQHLHSSQTGTIKHLEKVRVIGRFVVITVDDQDEGSSPTQDVSPLQEDDGSRAAASVTCRSVEVVGEEYGCFSCGGLCAAVKRAANAHVVAPIRRASQSLRRRIKQFFTRSSMVHDQQGVHHSAASTEAPASSAFGQRREDGTPDAPLRGPEVEAAAVLPQPTVKQGTKRLRFPRFKEQKRIEPGGVSLEE
ncbi:testis-specific serine/threonine-protein kinase 6-like [Salminus brasiliensis]|uniref:testis-specific serine/threonine-protein kinase 6-like n=1 Tax=Salminus brasiliensis TaxID=930266 RepID=UPI003B835925